MATRNVRRASDDSDDDAQWAAVPAGSVAMPESAEMAAEQSPIERVMVALQDTVEPGKRVRLQLYRVVSAGVGKPDREEWCCDLTPEEFEAGGLGAIRDAWGPGSYVAHLMGYKRGSTYFTRVASPRFTIATLPSGVASRPADSSSAGIEAALRALADSQARMLEAMMEQRNAPPPNPMQQMQETLSLMTAMRDAMGLTNQQQVAPQRSSIGEIVEAIKELKEVSSLVNPGDQPEKSDVQQLLEMAGPLVSMAQQAMQSQPRAVQPLMIPPQFSGESNDRPAAPVAPGVPTQQLRGISNASQVDATLSRSVESSSAAEEKTVSHDIGSAQSDSSLESSQESVLAELQTSLATLVLMAEQSESIENGANLVYDKLPDDWIELMHMPIWWQALTSAAPQVIPHEKWFAAVRERVIAMFAEDADDDPESEGSRPAHLS